MEVRMKTLVSLMTISAMLVIPQITKASLNWGDVHIAPTIKTSKLNDVVNNIGCLMPIKLISKQEILLEDKFSISTPLLAQEC